MWSKPPSTMFIITCPHDSHMARPSPSLEYDTQNNSRKPLPYRYKMTCHPGGHYLDFYPGVSSFSHCNKFGNSDERTLRVPVRQISCRDITARLGWVVLSIIAVDVKHNSTKHMSINFMFVNVKIWFLNDINDDMNMTFFCKLTIQNLYNPHSV